MAYNETNYKEETMKNMTDRLKKAWDENPLTVITVGAFVALTAAKVLTAVTEAKNAQTWSQEVQRRSMMTK